MAQLEFTLANGILTVGSSGRTTNYYITDFNIKSKGDEVIVYPKDGVGSAADVNRLWREKYDDMTVNGVTPTSAENAVEMWNYIAMGSIGYNTGYPQNLFSQHIVPDTSVDGQVVPVWIQTGHNGGYVTLTASEGNTGDIFVGESDVSNESYHLEPGKSITLELADLSLIWVQNEAPGDSLNVIGAAKT